MTYVALRLAPGKDLKKELRHVVTTHSLKAGIILTCVGSLKRATLRLADESVRTFDGPFEIVSLVGTLSRDGIHVHISLCDQSGTTIGGHMKEECIVHTTAEIVVQDIPGAEFSRNRDPSTGFKELIVKKR